MLEPESDDIAKLCSGSEFYIDPFYDGTGLCALSIVASGQHRIVRGTTPVLNLLAATLIRLGTPVCFEMRRLPVSRDDFVIDVRLLYGSDQKKVLGLAKEEIGRTVALSAAEDRFAANIRACKTARVDQMTSVFDLMPLWSIESVLFERAKVALDLLERKTRSEPRALERYRASELPIALTMLEVERTGIAVDIGFVKRQLELEHPTHVTKFFRSVSETAVDGLVYSRFNTAGGKTGRFRADGGFHAMSVPHGAPREAIVSRHAGGSISVIDFNAIDYRCIVRSIGGELAKTYWLCDDFHSRTASIFLAGDVDSMKRKAIKQITYTHVYGGSIETLTKSTGLSIDVLKNFLVRFDAKLSAIGDFRKKLASEARIVGHVKLPDGTIVGIDPTDHDGKILGLYAQTYSSHVFNAALIAAVDATVNMRTKVIFTVFDEIVLDVHPDELVAIDLVVRAVMASAGSDFAVNVKNGRTYDEASD